MRDISYDQMRDEFLDFFEERGHQRLESFSMIPQDDPSLLLVNAGMAPLKDYFTGDKKMPGNRAASSQRCIRTADIEEVGKTDRHGTFFEMLGNFSFGDYFKVEAIKWAWEFLTENMEIDADKLWVSVYEEDDESYDIWKDQMNIPESKIVRLGKEDNFWELEVGPCGPCTEIHYDRGLAHGCEDPDCKPGCECDRYLEVWNLVFTQFNKDEEGVYHPLAHPNIDTGMGLERLALVLEGADNIFEIKLMKDIIAKITELSGKVYKESEEVDTSIRVIADHMKAVTFLVYDGVIPSNEGRGYVLRRLMRRAIRHGKLLGIEGNFLNKIAQGVMDAYQVPYPGPARDKERIFKIIKVEEDQFNKTIQEGLHMLEGLIEKIVEEGGDTIPGDQAFRLYDTYGFPIDLTIEIGEENQMGVDIEAYKALMEDQRQRSRASRGSDAGGFADSKSRPKTKVGETDFTGYTKGSDKGVVLELFKDGQTSETLGQGSKGIIVTDMSPFYAEAGGQVGDTGYIYTETGKAKVLDTQKDPKGVYLHTVEVEEGDLKLEEPVDLEVDLKRRRAITKNHSATHLLHKALIEVLGDHVQQAGSLVDEKRLRFDFNHFQALTREELVRVEAIVNDLIDRSLDVSVNEMTLKDANAAGAVGLFEDKYQDVVRVVAMGDESIELCGGIHVHNTAEIQMFKIMSEAGVSAGVRRIEAITGPEIYRYLNQLEEMRNQAAANLRTQPQDLVIRSSAVMEELREKDREIERVRTSLQSSSAEDLLETATDMDGFKLLTHIFDDVDMDTLRSLGDQYRDKLGTGIVVLASVHDDKATFLATVSKDLVAKGYNAGNIVREVAQAAGGNGGGRPDFATAGARDVSKVEDAIGLVKGLVS